jgi:hypothetical protein
MTCEKNVWIGIKLWLCFVAAVTLLGLGSAALFTIPLRIAP